MKTALTLAAGAALLAASGVVHGHFTGRWADPAVLTAAAARVERLPAVVGDWESRPAEVSETTLALAEAAGHVRRTYTNRRTGDAVDVMLLVGRPGAIGAHTPDVCYAGLGYRMATPQEEWADGSDRYWHADFRKAGPAADGLRVYWSWAAADGVWRAARSPRFEFAGLPALYKLYAVRRPTAGEPAGADPAREFLRALAPAWRTE